MPREQLDFFRPRTPKESPSSSSDESDELMPVDDEVARPSREEQLEADRLDHPDRKYNEPKTRADREAARRRREELLRQGRVDILGEPGQPSLPTKPKRGR